ncbi:MAG: hypothetical protein AAGH68_06435 [Pseudomonadota bacterium]
MLRTARLAGVISGDFDGDYAAIIDEFLVDLFGHVDDLCERSEAREIGRFGCFAVRQLHLTRTYERALIYHFHERKPLEVLLCWTTVAG